MSFTVSSLTSYVDQISEPLAKKAVLGSNFFNTPGLVKLNGVGGASVAVPYLNSTIYGIAGGCSSSASGATEVAQISLSLCPIKYKTSECLQTLLDYFSYTWLPESSNPENMGVSFEQNFVAERVEKIQLDVEQIVWGHIHGTGTTTMGTSYGLCANSILKQAKTNQSTAVSATTTAITVGNAIQVIDDAIALIPAAVADKSDLTCFLSPASWYNLRTALIKTYNTLGQQIDPASMDEFMHPYNNMKVRKTAGLTGKNQIIITPASNIVVASKVGDEFNKVKMYFDQTTDLLWTNVDFRIGARIMFYELAVVLY